MVEKGKKGREERKKGGDRRGAHSCSLILIHINPWRPVARLRTRAHLSEERAAESALSQPSDDDSAAFLSPRGDASSLLHSLASLNGW